MKKSNDKDVPADEMLLAEAIAAAKARGLGWCKAVPFRDRHNLAIEFGESVENASSCCALGALSLAGRVTLAEAYFNSGSKADAPRDLGDVFRGNDAREDHPWCHGSDLGDSLGWAFRCAMTDDEVAS